MRTRLHLRHRLGVLEFRGRLPVDVLFAVGALLMAWDFFVKSGPLLPQFLRWERTPAPVPAE